MYHGGVLDDGEAQAGAAHFLGVALIHPIEAFKNPALVLRRDAYARIGHVEHRKFPFIADGELYTAILFVVLDGVFTEIVDHAAHKLPYAPYEGRTAAKGQGDVILLRYFLIILSDYVLDDKP